MPVPHRGDFDGYPSMPPVIYWVMLIFIIISFLSTLFVFFSFATLLRKKSTQEQRQGLYISINDTFMCIGGFFWASFNGVYLRNIGEGNPRCLAAGFFYFFAGVNQLSTLFLFSFNIYKRITTNRRVLTEKQILLICWGFSLVVCILPLCIPQIKYGPENYWCIMNSDKTFWGMIAYFFITSTIIVFAALIGFSFLIWKTRQIIKSTSQVKHTVKRAHILKRMAIYPIAIALIYVPIIFYHVASLGFEPGSPSDWAFIAISGWIHAIAGLVDLIIYNKNTSLIPAWRKYFEKRKAKRNGTYQKSAKSSSSNDSSIQISVTAQGTEMTTTTEGEREREEGTGGEERLRESTLALTEKEMANV